MLFFFAFLSISLAAPSCREAKEEFVPHCGKCVYDEQCVGYAETADIARQFNYPSLMYCCPNLKRCLSADPEDPTNHSYEGMSCSPGDYPEGDDEVPGDCRDTMSEAGFSNYRGDSNNAGCSERSLDYPSGCQCAPESWPDNWATGCDNPVEPTQKPTEPVMPEGGWTCTCTPNDPYTAGVTEFCELAGNCYLNSLIAAQGNCEDYQGRVCTMPGGEPEATESEVTTARPKGEESTESPKKGEESTESPKKEEPEMSCDECASGFVLAGGCAMVMEGSDPTGAVPEGCNPEVCMPQIGDQCGACDSCAQEFGANGGCEVVARNGAHDEIEAALPEGCSGETCGASIMGFCKEIDYCRECVPGFVDAGGCELAAAGEDPTSLFPEGCNPNYCGQMAHEACMQEGTDSSMEGSMEDMYCPEAMCECNSDEKMVTTMGEDGCEVCGCIPVCECSGSCRASKKTGIESCKVQRTSMCTDKKQQVRGKGRRKKTIYTSELACMDEEAQLEFIMAMQTTTSMSWEADTIALYGFAAIGASSLLYYGFSGLKTLSGRKSYTAIQEESEL